MGTFTSKPETVEAFGWKGAVDGDSREALAKKVTGQSRVTHLAMVGNLPPHAGQLYNPLATIAPGSPHRQNGATGQTAFAFRRVSEKAYQLYTSFLKSHDPLFVNQAQREIQ